MKMIIRYILPLATVALAVVVGSCSKHEIDDPEPSSGKEIVLSADIPSGWSPLETRSEITSVSDLQTAGFGVYAYYTGTNSYSDISSAQGVIFNNRQVSYSASKWSYGTWSEYWPTKAGEKVSFFAYAPWSDWNTVVTPRSDASAADNSAPTISYTVIDEITTSKIAAQKDLLWGTQSSGSPYRNITRNDVGGKVDFHFRHAISKMRFYVAGSIPGDIEAPRSPEEYGDWGDWSTYSGSDWWSTERVRWRQGYRYYTVTATKFFVRNLTVSGLYPSGVLSLNNNDAYVPLWNDVSGSRSYTISSDNVLRNTLYSTSSTGIVESLTAVMSDDGSYLYVIPNSQPTFSVTYYPRNSVTTYRIRAYQYCRQTRSGWDWPSDGTGEIWYEDSGSASVYGSTSTSNGSDNTVSATIPGNIQPGRKYDINLHLGGSEVELVVVPKNWDVDEMPPFDYTDDENRRIQQLTYDSDYIDYAIDSKGEVYINNRLGRFYFCLGLGKYKYWQASLISSDMNEVFAFCDSGGNFLYDESGNFRSIIRGPIDGNMSSIYMRAIDPVSTTGGRAKLRIYLFDSDEVPTVALNLVNMAGVTEWTIVQNAN